MKPDDVANAITQALVQGGSQWLVASLVAFLPAMWTMALVYYTLVARMLYGRYGAVAFAWGPMSGGCRICCCAMAYCWPPLA